MRITQALKLFDSDVQCRWSSTEFEISVLYCIRGIAVAVVDRCTTRVLFVVVDGFSETEDPEFLRSTLFALVIDAGYDTQRTIAQSRA